MSLIVKIEGVDVNTGTDLDRNVRDSVTIKRTYEKKRSLSCAVYYKAADTFPLEGQDIEVYDDTTLLFGGIIQTIDYEATSPAQSSSAWVKLTVSSNGYNFIPQRRTVNVDYPAGTTAATIVSAMITSFLSAEGITAGTVSTGATFDLGYSGQYKSVKEILDDMAEASGYTWNINDSKQLDFIAPTTPTTSTFSIVEGQRTHFNFRPKRALGSFRNKQFVEGGQDDTGAVVRVVVEDTANITARAAAEGNSGVYGNVIRDSNIQSATDATAAATEALNRNKNLASASFDSWSDYGVGDLIPITYAKYDIAASTKYLILTQTIKRDKRAWRYSYSVEVRDETDYSGKAQDDGVDFFSKMAKGVIYTAGKAIQGIINLFVQSNEPTGAPENSVWIDTDDYSRYDVLPLTIATTLDASGEESIEANGTFTVTLFTAVGNSGVIRRIKNVGTGIITIDGDGTETIDGATTYELSNQYDFIEIESDGTNWKILAQSGGGISSVAWGDITGTLSNQTDLQSELDDKADKSNVLELDNTTSFTPDADYEPATKKYVDDAVTGAGGLPIGGTTGQVLAKASNTDYDTEWINQSGGTGGQATTYTTSGAISVNDTLALLDASAGTLNMTLGDGVEGQILTIKLIDATNEATITPSNFYDATFFQLLNENDSAILQFDGTDWQNTSTLKAVTAEEKTATIDHTLVDADLTDYPVMVKLTISNWDFSDFQTDGSDIYFRDSGDTTDLKFEREYYDATEEIAIFWVKIPTVSSTVDTTFLVRNGSVTDREDATNAWNSNYKAVLHMDALLQDSTANGYDGTNVGTTTVDGLNGKARSFDGSDDYIDMPSAAAISGDGSYCIQALINADTPLDKFLVGWGVESSNQATGMSIASSTRNLRHFWWGNDFDTTAVFATGVYQFLTVSYNGSTKKNYINDSAPESDSQSGHNASASNFRLGRRIVTSSAFYQGIMCEMRVMSTAPSDAWVKADDHGIRQNDLLTVA